MAAPAGSSVAPAAESAVGGARQEPEPQGRGRSTQQQLWVLRFNRTERLVHWVQAITFLLLLSTGLIISIASLEAIVGHRAFLREVHLIAAFFFVFGPALVALAGNFRSIREDEREVDGWTRDDIHWLARPKVEPDALTPPAGRYNAGQKANAIFTVYSVVAFGVTGLILWQNRRFPFSVVSQANTVHTYLAYLAFAVFLGHLYLAVVHPATRQAFHGIVFGTVKRSWAERHHPQWATPAASESPLKTGIVVRSIIVLLIGLEGALLLSRFGLEWLGANVTDPVTKLIYQYSGLPGALQHTSTGVRAFDLAALIWAGFAFAAAFAVAKSSRFVAEPRHVPAND
jgi:formate dehydrogenase subunit gamma